MNNSILSLFEREFLNQGYLRCREDQRIQRAYDESISSLMDTKERGGARHLILEIGER